VKGLSLAMQGNKGSNKRFSTKSCLRAWMAWIDKQEDKRNKI
jgi:hypothetical protein